MRTARHVTALVLTVLLLAVAGSAWGQRAPIKVGMFVPLSGPLAANAKEMVNGLTLFLGEQGNRLAGREVRLAIEEDGSPFHPERAERWPKQYLRVRDVRSQNT